MKKEKWILPAVAGVAVAAGIAYALWPKNTVPAGAEAVKDFDLEKFAGTWNEIARLPIRIEKNFSQLIERYIPNGDGTFRVITRAYNPKKEHWIEATGELKAAKPGTGKLKVSYLKPFYLNYNILDVDENYDHVLASGSSKDTLWLLSRDTAIPEAIEQRFLKKAAGYGFDTGKLIWNAL